MTRTKQPRREPLIIKEPYYDLAFSGYVDFKTDHDKAIDHIDSRWSEPAGVIRDDVVMFDLDNKDEGEAIMKCLDDDNTSYLYQESTKGYHVFLKNNYKLKKVGEKGKQCALTVKVSTACANNSTRFVLCDRNNEKRPLMTSKAFDGTLSDTPAYLTFCDSDYHFFDMDKGGRNDSLSKYVLSLASKGYSWDEAKRTIEHINNRFLGSRLDRGELKAILRDDTKAKYESYARNRVYPYLNTKNGTPLKVWENLRHLLQKNNVCVKENLLTKEIDTSPNNIDFDNLCIDINTWCQIDSFNLPITTIRDFTARVASNNKYNPVQEYLTSISWDGVSRIETLFNTLVLEDNADRDFAFRMFEKWLCGCVKIAFNDNATISLQGVLVLKGNQGIKKTTWLKNLVPNKEWFAEGRYLDVDNKDNVMINTRSWIVELGELKSTIKDINKLKAYLTSSTDTLRVPYGRSTKTYNRYTSYCGSVNDDEFLKDETGDRRWWVIPVKECRIDDTINLSQVWAEVVYKTNKGLITHYFNAEEIKNIMDNNRAYSTKSELYHSLVDTYDFACRNSKLWKWKTATEIIEELGLSSKNNRKVKQVIKEIAQDFDLDIDTLIHDPAASSKSKQSCRYFIPPVNEPFKEKVEINDIQMKLRRM